jgi:hypothetical protein
MSYLEKPESLDFFLRLLVKNIRLDFGSYIYSNQSIHLDAITAEHIQSCEEFPNCFCNTQVRIAILLLNTGYLTYNHTQK